ncbi:uncharacterized protein LOC106642086 [Copidosoma floridanum]|uniref:uncharacterized protein LOC106642086 n=1 Tax=Copidosoma floridanum TaxID=29053 RepID=UPI0006C9AD69|nr:uncharacterized protein LOC106642086 [Copidosoma floridanum]
MAYRNIFKQLLNNLRPIHPVVIYATTVFISPDPPKNPNDDQKLIFETPNASNLSYDYLFKQSTVSAVNSASQTLTVTYTAIETTSREYRKLLNRLISLMNEAIMHDVSDAHWDEILEIRSQIHEKKKLLTKFIAYMEYVHKMSEAASEISFLAGMDNLSTSLTQRIDDALRKVQIEKQSNSELEHEYVRIQEEAIKNANKKNDTEDDTDTQDVQLIDLDNLDDD